MVIRLSHDDYDRLAAILSEHGEWRSVHGRIDFVADIFAGSTRQDDIVAQLDLDGPPRSVAVRVIERLRLFGQDEPGREALGVLVNKLIASLGGGGNADFLRALLGRYSFKTQPVAARAIEGWHGKETDNGVAEKVIGENTLRDIYILEVLFELARAVVRVRSPQGLGTGFLIAQDLVMTNNHVIGSADDARICAVEFNYQLDRRRKALPVHTARAADDGLFYTSPMAPYNATEEQLDYTVVQLKDMPDGIVPLNLKAAPIQRDSRLTVIQHPGGDYKKISFQNNFVEYVDNCVVQYTTSTEPGSSGAPVLNDSFQVVAIHHAGGDLTEPSTKRRYLRNEGIRASAILEDLHRKAPSIYDLISK